MAGDDDPSLGVRTMLATVLPHVDIGDGDLQSISLASRYGNVRVSAAGFVDASGDAALTWEAGCRAGCRNGLSTARSRSSSRTSTRARSLTPGEIDARIAAKAASYGLLRRGGLAFFFPGRGTAVLNVTHIEAPLDPVRASAAQLDGKAQADAAIALLRAEFPKAFGEARVRAYGYPGRRQTRWIRGRHQLTLDEVRAGNAVRRRGRPHRLADRAARPRRRLRVGDVRLRPRPLRPAAQHDPAGAHNLVAAGRCVDGDAAALSSVRVMGPCAAMGAGPRTRSTWPTAAACTTSTWAELRERLAGNVG